MPEKILIIKHGAFGDWIFATGVFKAIRHKHPNAHIVLLTESLYFPLAEQSKLFDEIWKDNRQKFYKLESLKVIVRIRKAQFTHVYDIQRSHRTDWYYRLVNRPGLYWSGRIKTCPGYFVDDLERHIVERMALQLNASGIEGIQDPDISWLSADISSIKPNKKYAIIIPGGSKHRPTKQWTAEGYASVIDWLHQKEIQAVIIGTEVDREIIDRIIALIKMATPLNAINQTSFAQLAELARHSELILGGDTGPMHLAYNTGTPAVMLFYAYETSPGKPWKGRVSTLVSEDLKKLGSNDVIQAIEKIIK